MLGALDLQRVEDNAFHLVDEGQRAPARSVTRSSEEDKDCFGKLPKPTGWQRWQPVLPRISAGDSGHYSRQLIDEKRTRFLKYLVEFFGGHF
jgi:hypothetical protein